MSYCRRYCTCPAALVRIAPDREGRPGPIHLDRPRESLALI